ncbi:MAG TPA: LLM class flavin-dependent oxidoreductase [Candidatus Bathyarchaeia archaeon]|nr:LLM class flavin-dependent oxidoreductase [Candidatus Bathyarchaeia archaeon]
MSTRNFPLGLNVYDDYYSSSNWFSSVDIVRAIKLADQSGLHSVWLNEDIGRDSFVMLGNISNQTRRIRLATGIVNVYTRSAVQIAMAIATLDELSGGRAILGLGTGHDRSVLAGHGIKVDHPLERMRDYVTIIRKVLSGEYFSHENEIVQIKRSRLNIKHHALKVPIFLAARTRETVHLAGELADGVLLNMPSKKWIKDEVLPNIRNGTESSGRHENDVTVAAIIHCHLSNDKDRACEAAKRSIVGYSKSKAFVRMVSQMGYSSEIRKIHHIVIDGNAENPSKYVPDELARELVPFGTLNEIMERVEDLVKNGIKLPILSFRPQFGESIQLVEEAIRAFAT